MRLKSTLCEKLLIETWLKRLQTPPSIVPYKGFVRVLFFNTISIKNFLFLGLKISQRFSLNVNMDLLNPLVMASTVWHQKIFHINKS